MDRSPRRAPPEAWIEGMFDRVADRYDLGNRLLSAGFDGRWRRETAAALRARPWGRVLDLGAGTGRLGDLLAARFDVVGVDVSHAMLVAATRRGARATLVQGSAFALPFQDGSFDGAASGFVLRNLDDLEAAFAELARVLVPGGGLAIADITEPRRAALRRLFDAYFRMAAPAVGSVVRRRQAYGYLSRSLAQLPPPAEVVSMLERAGFGRVSERPLFPGMVTLWTATRA